MQHTSAHIKGNCDGIRSQAQTPLTRHLAGWRTHVVQVVCAFFKLVLQCHAKSMLVLLEKTILVLLASAQDMNKDVNTLQFDWQQGGAAQSSLRRAAQAIAYTWL